MTAPAIVLDPITLGNYRHGAYIIKYAVKGTVPPGAHPANTAAARVGARTEAVMAKLCQLRTSRARRRNRRSNA